MSKKIRLRLCWDDEFVKELGVWMARSSKMSTKINDVFEGVVGLDWVIYRDDAGLYRIDDSDDELLPARYKSLSFTRLRLAKDFCLNLENE
jgi:hypothetical protein